MPDLEIIFKTKAELAGARALQESLERQIGAAKAAGKDFSELQKQVDKVNASLAGAGKEGAFEKLREGLGEIIPGFSQLDGIISKLGAGGLAAIAGGFAALATGLEGAKRSIEEFASAEQHVARLDTALAQTGQLTKEYRERLQELAHEFQNTTGIAEDQWLGVLTKLTQFGADAANITEVSDAVKNLAGILGGDLQTAATLVSRALQGNYLMFARYGIQVEEAGTQTEKFEALCRQLAERGGGQLEAMTKGLSGKFNELKLSTGDLFKSVGRGIADFGLLQSALQAAINVTQAWGEILSGPIKMTEGLGNAAVKTKQQIDGATPDAAYSKALDQIKSSASQAADQLDKLLLKAEALKSSEDQLADAQKATQIAQVNSDVESGKISKSEGERRKGEIEISAVKAAADRQQKLIAEQDLIASAKVKAADRAQNAAEAAVLKEQANIEQKNDPRRKLLGSLGADLSKNQNELNALNERYDSPLTATSQLRAIWDRMKDLEAIIGKQKPLVDALTKEVGEGGSAGDLKKLAELKKAAEELAKGSKEAHDQYDREHVVGGIQAGAVGKVAAERVSALEIETTTGVTKAQEEERKKKEEEFKKQLQEHQKLGIPLDTSALDHAGRDVTNGLTALREKTVELFEQVTEQLDGHNTDLDNVSQRLTILESRTGNRA